MRNGYETLPQKLNSTIVVQRISQTPAETSVYALLSHAMACKLLVSTGLSLVAVAGQVAQSPQDLGSSLYCHWIFLNGTCTQGTAPCWSKTTHRPYLANQEIQLCVRKSHTHCGWEPGAGWDLGVLSPVFATPAKCLSGAYRTTNPRVRSKSAGPA